MSGGVELRKCPFCGGEAELVETEGGIGALFHISCKDDDCCGYILDPLFKAARRIEAANRWNTRTTEAADLITDLVSALEAIAKTDSYGLPELTPQAMAFQARAAINRAKGLAGCGSGWNGNTPKHSRRSK